MPAALLLLSLTHDIMVAKMAHRRIRKFNTKHTYPEQNLDNDLAQAVVTQGGKIVWLRFGWENRPEIMHHGLRQLYQVRR